MELEENEKNCLDHILDLTKRKKIEWSLSDSDFNSCVFTSKVDVYHLELRLSKGHVNKIISFFLYITYNGTDRNIPDNSERIYVPNILNNKYSKEMVNIIISDNNYEWQEKKSETVLDFFLDDTAKPLMREKKINDILEQDEEN